MKIIICMKNVPNEEEIDVKSDRTLDFSLAGLKIGQYDLNAMEAASRLSEKYEGVEMVSLTAGGNILDNTKQRKDILSRGSARLYGLQDDELQGSSADPYIVGTALASAIKNIGDADLVLFGEGSGDLYAQQTGSVTGALLGWPTLNAVTDIAVEDGRLLLERTLEDGSEMLRVDMPAVVSVTSDINIPRFASMKEIFSAGKKPVQIRTAPEAGCELSHGTVSMSVLVPEETGRRCEVYETADDAAIEAIAGQIKKLL